MLNGRPPFESQEVKQTYKKIKAGAFQFPEHINIGNFAKDLIRQCLTVDLAKRISLQEMLEHDFFTLVQIPQQMPVSTLVCPPAHSFVKQYALPLSSSLASDMSPNPAKNANCSWLITSNFGSYINLDFKFIEVKFYTSKYR